MSNDMSMFRKMKERITDEVNSATNKFQNMQIIDQLASSITNQQMRNDMTPNQLVPEPHDLSPSHSPLATNSTNVPVNSQFSLIDDSPVGNYNEEEELNSEISPQHQLFDEHSIKRLTNQSERRSSPLDNNNEILSHNHNGSAAPKPQGSAKENVDNFQSVINIYELSSDIEDGLDQASDTNSKDDGPDVEIDLLSDKPISNYNDSYDRKNLDNHLPFYKSKYRELVHDLRKKHHELGTERSKSQLQRQELTNQITALKMELDGAKQQLNLSLHDSLNNISASVSDNDKSSSVGSPQPSLKSSTKLRDLEKLLAKCKESLKVKNSQIKELKETLNESEKFKVHNEELKRELMDLRESHESWTVSIAENKRIMHQEIEDKNNELERLRSIIQDLESRLVRTSAAHQKERENLIKELTTAKSNAIRQVQKESEHNIERVKLDLEKSIEALKVEILNKDEQLIKLNVQLKGDKEQFQQEIHELNTRLNLMTTANDDQEKEIKSIKEKRDFASESYESLRVDFEELHKKNESLSRLIEENETDLQSQQEHLSTLEQEMDSLRKENGALNGQVLQYKSELDERTQELTCIKDHDDVISDQLAKLKANLENTQNTIEELRKDRDSLAAQNGTFSKERRDFEEQLVIGIVSAMKNLETPNTSPGSDKSYESFQQDSSSIREERSLPNPVTLIEKLSSLALDRSNAYLTTTQRLQAVLLENTMIGEELRRLKDELNNLNRENSLATQCSLNEVERLRTENQALIHDQQAYDERITSLEREVDRLNRRLKENDNSADIVPSSTEFEYLKNIGKETLVLARVIAAVFKFDKNQIEQICKIQEALQPATRQNN